MQKRMLEHQSQLILEMTDKMKGAMKEDEMRNELPDFFPMKDKQVINHNLHQHIVEKQKSYKELYKKVKDGQKNDNDLSNDESDNDSFITIDTSDEDSDYSHDTSESSDNGIIDTFGSYGVNPMFSKSVEDQTFNVQQRMQRVCVHKTEQGEIQGARARGR